MSSFNANFQNYNVVAENELAEVLSHYNSDFVFNIVNDAIQNRFKEISIIARPNVVWAWNQNFETITAQYGPSNEINRVKNDTYKEIIEIICKAFGLDYAVEDPIDMYFCAGYLYDLLVCNFNEYLSTFYTKLIYKERVSLYESLNLSDLKKNKDTSTIYGKRIYKDIKLAIINANIEMVINQINSMDIKFYNIVEMIYGAESEHARYLLSMVSDNNNDFFNTIYVSMFNSDIRSDIITNIRLKLQELAMNDDQINPINSNSEGDQTNA